MKCSNCNEENSETAKFCKKCGAPLKERTINHGDMINSINDNKAKSDNTTKIIIIALAVVAVVLAGAFIYLYAFGDSGANDTNNNSQSASQDSVPQANTETPKTAQKTTPSMRILGGSFSTGSADADKTYAQIYVGKEHAGESVIVQIYYSRDGSNLNNGNMVPANVHSDGYLYISSADAYKYYPDHATINLYDSSSNLMDTQSVTLSPTSGTQTF